MTRSQYLVKKLALVLLLFPLPLLSQSTSGELRLRVTDPSGLGVKTTLQIISQANQYRNTLVTSDQGTLDVQRLPYGTYQLQVSQAGFAPVSESLDIHSSIPTEYAIQLKLPTVNQSVTV